MQIKRRFVRWQINKEAKVSLGASPKFISCILNDISYMGCRLTLPLRLPKDTYQKISLALDEVTVIEVEAWVVWSKHLDGHYIYAFYFTKIKDTDKEKIYRYVLQTIPEEMKRGVWEMPPRKEGGEKMEDRRIFARFSARMPVRFLDYRENREGTAETADISAKGMSLVTVRDIAAHTLLELWVEVPDKGEPLYTRGEVAWVKQVGPQAYQLGVNLEKADLMGLSRVLRAV
jgi:c-di-GMP-binding flagellar brake protein YcgR